MSEREYSGDFNADVKEITLKVIGAVFDWNTAHLDGDATENAVAILYGMTSALATVTTAVGIEKDTVVEALNESYDDVGARAERANAAEIVTGKQHL